MSMRKIGRVSGLLLAIMVGGAGVVNAQVQHRGEAHPEAAPRAHQRPQAQPCSTDTIRGRLLGEPVPASGPARVRAGVRGRVGVRGVPGVAFRARAFPGPMMGGGMLFGGLGSEPAAMLLRRNELDLTPDQVQRLEVLAATHMRTREELMPQVMRGAAELMGAASGEVDLDASQRAYDRLSGTVSELLMADLRIKRDARQVLTPGQRTRWDAMREELSVRRRLGSRVLGPAGPMRIEGHRGDHRGHHTEPCR